MTAEIILWELIAAGAIGGIARSAYAALKSGENGRKVNLWLYFISVIVGAFLGAALGSVFKTGDTLAALIGFVGSDIMDNIVTGVVPKAVGI